MYGYNGFNHYDPIPFYMMMGNFFKDKKSSDIEEEDVIRHFKRYKDLYQDMKKEFEPPKSDGGPKKKEDAWTTNDYFTFIVCFVSVVGLGGAWLIIHELTKLAEIIHR